MLVFQCHLPHVIPNSMQESCALSHSWITFQKAPFPYQHVSLKRLQNTIEKLQMLMLCLCHDGRIYERFSLKTNMHLKISDMEIPTQAADEYDAPLVEWGLNTFMSIPASSKHVCSQWAMVLLQNGACFPNQNKNNLVCGVFVFMHLKYKVWDS